MNNKYTFTGDIFSWLGEPKPEEPKEGLFSPKSGKPEAPVAVDPARDMAQMAVAALGGEDAARKAMLNPTTLGPNDYSDLDDWTVSTVPFMPQYRGDAPAYTALQIPPVTTTDLGPDMDTMAMQDAQEQAAIRSASDITESLGRPAPAGLMSPPVQDTVSGVDTSVPIPAEEAEAVTPVADTAATTPTRDELIDSVFDAEGGYSTDRDDTGNYYRGQFVGTNHGISAPVLAEHLGRTPTVEDMRGLTQDTAREIAATQYYDTYNISDLPDETQEIVFHAVYMGGSRGVRAVQNLTGSTPDGVMGPNTRTAMQESTFTPQEFRDEYLRELEFGTTGYSSPAATWDVHGTGWSNRYNELAGE